MTTFYGISARMAVVFTLATSFLNIGLAQASSPAGTAARGASITGLRKEIVARTREDELRITPEYAASRLSEISALARQEVLETLDKSEKPEDVRAALRAVLGDTSDDAHAPFAFAADLKGVRIMVVGYDILYGGSGIPNAYVVIEGFRKEGAGYGFAAATGAALKNCELTLEKLESPRTNEIWLFAHGHQYGFMGHEEVVRIYGFDGSQFTDLWAPDPPRINPEYQRSPGKIRIRYERRGLPRGGVFWDEVDLTSDGPVVTTTPAN